MRREERNAKISELRREWCSPENDIALTKASPEETHGLAKPIDWHADANWPTLLREMPHPRIERVIQWEVSMDIRRTVSIYGDVEHSELADAVCEAWLQWKQPALGKGAGSD